MSYEFYLLIFCRIFLYLYISEEYWSTLFFLCTVFIWFWYQGNTTFIKWVKNYAFLFYLVEEIAFNFSLYVWKISPVKPLVPGDFFQWNFKITNSISLMVTELFKLFRIGWVMVVCVFLRIKLINTMSTWCQICHQQTSNLCVWRYSEYFILWCCRVCSDTLCFIPDVDNLCFLFFNLWILLEVYQFY